MIDLKKPSSINMSSVKKAENIDLYDIDTQITSKIAVNIEAVRMECNETVDAFIFSYIMPYVDSIAEIKISKQELIEAVQLIKAKRKAREGFGVELSYDISDATERYSQLEEAYNNGFEDGYEKASQEMMEYLKEKIDVEEEN